MSDGSLVALKSLRGRGILAATIIGSAMALLDGTVVNIALPAIDRDLDAGVTGLQWTINGYTLALAALILIGGALGDRWGRKRLFLIGTAWFAVASVLCGFAWNVEVLVAARVIQGVGAALLTPGSLAILQSTLRSEDRGAAIGLWSGLGGVAGAIGPFVGGFLIEHASWRAVFFLNVPLAVLVLVIGARFIPETRDEESGARLDWVGAAVAALALALLTLGLIEGEPLVTGAGFVALIAFIVTEARRPNPLVPLRLFRNLTFAGGNLMTFLVYGALSGVLLLLVLQLQLVVLYRPLAAGMSTIPLTILLLLLSSRMGKLTSRIGARLPMTIGPVVCAAGLLLMLRIGPGATYLVDIGPAIIVFGLGMAILVAPLTTAVLAAVPDHQAGIASGINNAVARSAGLLAVAALPGLSGIDSAAFNNASAFNHGFHIAVWICAGLMTAGGAISFVTIGRVRAV